MNRLPPMPQPLTDRVLSDLAVHPDTTAGRIALRLDANQHIVTELLSSAMRRGLCTRRKEKATWHWTAVAPAAEP